MLKKPFSLKRYTNLSAPARVLRDAGMLDSIDLPPEIRNLQPRKKGGDADYDNILDGLPSDAELRLAHGQGKKITAFELEKDKNLVGTLTPSQVAKIDLEEIPAVLAVVRKSKDGPQAQTLEALSKRFAEYVRSKSEDYDSPDKKLLKYMTAAEVSKLPATVLAYFIDHRQTSKLPPDDKLTGGTSKIDVPELAAIGQGVADLPPNEVEKLTPVALESAIQVIQGTSDDDDDGLKQRACLTPDQRKAWRKKIIENYGDPASWDPSTVSTLCCALGLLEEGDLRTIAPDALVTCQCVSDSKPPSHLAELKKALEANCKHELGEDVVEHPKKVVERVKSELTFDLDDLESQIITRRRRRSVDNLNCFKVRLTGSGSAFSKEQLETLDENELDNCLYELGVDPLTVDNARVIWKKLLASRNNQVKAEDVQNAGHILSGITINDVNELDLADPDIVLAFGKPLGLSKNVLEKLAMRLEQVKEKSVTQFDSEELVVTNNILCGFSSEQLTEIDADLLREALPVLKSIDPSCEQTRLAALAAVTVKADAFGDPKNWTSADVRGVGTILNGLPLSLVNTIPAESFLGVTPTVAAAMPETLLKELSAEQIANIPRFSAQAMSAEQVDAFGEEARDTLLSVIKGPTSSNGFSIQPQSQAFFLTATTLLIFRTAISYNVL
ncbi:Stereocilin [Orchesella cincta]|uniref:Stereocilin n=1 Tax=Orchesella cincta TaxID=48709 RepID=A0A1D2N3T3_ORCCI|nr:Stereocilin [Orchesella cincta]